jgi:hypothetical protein
MVNDKQKKKQLDGINSLKKRQYGLAKKAEQLRRSTGVEVALFIYDNKAQQYYTYLSKIEGNWPPSIAEVVGSPFLSWIPHTHLSQFRYNQLQRLRIWSQAIGQRKVRQRGRSLFAEEDTGHPPSSSPSKEKKDKKARPKTRGGRQR